MVRCLILDTYIESRMFWKNHLNRLLLKLGLWGTKWRMEPAWAQRNLRNDLPQEESGGQSLDHLCEVEPA